MDYNLLDSGDEKKFEQFGPHKIIRPCPQAVWKASGKWDGVEFKRDSGWEKGLPKSWVIEYAGVKMKLAPTDFGHLGIFPEHAIHIEWIRSQKPKNILNLFAYSGLLTMAAGCEVCHVDSSKGMVSWAKENAKLNGVSARWIVDDAMKFMKREVKRGSRYDGIILDPPTFGRGSRGEVFKIERDLVPLLQMCHLLKPSIILLSCHTPGITPRVLEKLLPRCEAGETLLQNDLPCGVHARWCK